MRYGIPLLGNRVAPRCACADCMLVITLSRGRFTDRERLPLDITSPLDMVSRLHDHRIDTLICGGIKPEMREKLEAGGLSIVDNVACSADQVLAAIVKGRLRPGYGFGPDPDPEIELLPPDGAVSSASGDSGLDCLACNDRVCLRGEVCLPDALQPAPRPSAELHRMLEAATDISSETERQLCRLAELVYFCFEMRYRRVGIAFCEDLREPARILSGVLRRSFEVAAIGCKVGGPPAPDPRGDREAQAGAPALPPPTCNPLAQAQLLNRAGTDLNVIVGLCMGADCVFTGASAAPVTTLFVKDRSLANNPIGAVYSEYYLQESVATARPQAAAGAAGHEAVSPYQLSERHSAREEPS